MNKKTQLKNNQDGLVSIIISMLIMVILTLLVTGFSQIMQRNEKQVTDKLLNTQAFYAAESGLNDTIVDIRNKNIDLTAVTPNTCITPSSNNNLESTGNTAYKCVMANQLPSDLLYSDVKLDQSTLTLVKTPTNNVKYIVISWQSTVNSDLPLAANVNLPKAASWPANTIGMLRVSLYPVLSGGSDRNTLNSMARTYFLYPLSTAGSSVIDYATTLDGSIVSEKCNHTSSIAGISPGPYSCNVIIDVSSLAVDNAYYMRLKSVYKDSAVSLSAFPNTNAGTPPLKLSDAQISIDVTGASTDVKRRINARISQISQFNWPEYAIESSDLICKLLQTAPNNTVTDPANCPIP